MGFLPCVAESVLRHFGDVAPDAQRTLWLEETTSGEPLRWCVVRAYPQTLFWLFLLLVHGVCCSREEDYSSSSREPLLQFSREPLRWFRLAWGVSRALLVHVLPQ